MTDPQAASATVPGSRARSAPRGHGDQYRRSAAGRFRRPGSRTSSTSTRPNLFHRFVENILRKGVTAGCATPGNYCPANPVTRAQMAVFLLKSKYGATYVPPPANGPVFGDVPPSNPFAPWIEQLATELITAGCSSGNYCPNNPVTRAQMAVFLLKSARGPNLRAARPRPVSSRTCRYRAPSRRGSTCSPMRRSRAAAAATNYCPNNPVTRGQMAVFLTKTFGYVN